MLILDTDLVAGHERAEAFQASVSQNCSTSLATFDDPSTVTAHIEAFELGPTKILNIEASGNTLRRTPRMARGVDECSIALALPMRTQNRMMWDREERLFGPADMILVDLSSPYVYGWSGAGASYALHVDFDLLGLPMDTIRAATRQVHTSPVYPLVRDHIVRMTSRAATLADDPGAEHLGAATVELMRALIISAVGDDQLERTAMHSTMSVRVQAYVRRHLRDHDLTPERIAAENAVSLRTLYALYEELGVSLEQSIIRQRLDGARIDLREPRLRHRAIGAIAGDWGFSNASFFARRFREAFGVTPRQWRAGERAVPGADGRSG